MHKLTIPCGVAVAVINLCAQTLPTIAYAQPQTTVEDAASPDLVQLLSGELLRGRVTEVRPSVSLTIVLADGSVRIVNLADVELASGPGFSYPEPASIGRTATVPVPDAPQPTNVASSAHGYGASDDLRDPGPGRVPLVVESVGHPITVGESFGQSGSGRGATLNGREPVQCPVHVVRSSGSVCFAHRRERHHAQ